MNYKPVKTDFIWTGDGFGASRARRIRQLKRIGDIALYERTVQCDGRPDGFEVIKITRHNGYEIGKGNKKQFIEAAESYPGASQGGMNAVYPSTLARAEVVFAEWVAAAEAQQKREADALASGIVLKKRGRPKKVK